MSVDSAASRREARRRKILENPEKRLNKIINCDISRAGKVSLTVDSLKNQWEHCNGVAISDKTISSENFETVNEPHSTVPSQNEIDFSAFSSSDKPILSFKEAGISRKTDDKNEEFEIITKLRKTGFLLDKSKRRENFETFNELELRDAVLPPNKIDYSTFGGNEEPVLLPGEEKVTGNSKKIEDKYQFLFWSDLFFIFFVSIIVRLMYSYNMSSMFAESLFVPFVTIFIAKLAANPSKHTAKSVQRGGMLRASLILSGVPKSWLDKIFMFIQMCVDLGHDFALYFFSFSIAHIFLESFVNR